MMWYGHKILSSIFLIVATASVFIMQHHKKQFCEAYVNGRAYACAIGRSGVTPNKTEGDGGTPVGDFPLRKVFYRSDRLAPNELQTQIPSVATQPTMGWCDDERSAFYNQQIVLPSAVHHENLWQNDFVYDVVVVVGYNDAPPIKRKGSAIFLHVARKGYTPTAGCIAFAKKDLLEILRYANACARIQILPDGKVYIYNG